MSKINKDAKCHHFLFLKVHRGCRYFALVVGNVADFRDLSLDSK